MNIGEVCEYEETDGHFHGPYRDAGAHDIVLSKFPDHSSLSHREELKVTAKTVVNASHFQNIASQVERLLARDLAWNLLDVFTIRAFNLLGQQ